MTKTNNSSLCRDSCLRRMASYLRKRWAGPGRIVSVEMIRGASYSLGSGAVSLLVLWFQSRH